MVATLSARNVQLSMVLLKVIAAVLAADLIWEFAPTELATNLIQTGITDATDGMVMVAG